MSEEAKKAMNDMHVFDANVYYTQHGLAILIGNGQVYEIVPEERAEEDEIARCEHGF